MSSSINGLIQLSQSTGVPAARRRICLVIPPSPFLLDERVFASLGILKVAAELEPFHDVSVLDLSGVENYLEAIDVCPPADVFGVTATTPQMPAAMKIGARLRRTHAGARLILGGPHVTLVYAASRSESRKQLSGGRSEAALAKLGANFDVLVAGDGEKAIHGAIRPDSPAV